MDIQHNGAAPERVDFSKIKTSIPIPNLIEVQKKSYERFLQMDLLPNEREDIGSADRIQLACFRFPIFAASAISSSSITRSATGSASAAT